MPKGYKGREKSERLHLLASPEEIQAIEDWQFKNRISSKGEAIRRLVQIGIRADRTIPVLLDKVLDMIHRSGVGDQISDEQFEKLPPEAQNVLADAIVSHAQVVSWVFDISNEIGGFVDNPDLATALLDADKLKAEPDRTVKRLVRRLREAVEKANSDVDPKHLEKHIGEMEERLTRLPGKESKA
jgi:hypothetical protein